MKVLGVGFGRTATLSLKEALEQLGANPCFHMLELLGGANKDRDLPYWVRAINGQPVDWREVFAPWEATVDWPACSFWEQLIDAFPHAKVLLNVRDFDGWYASCQNTLLAVREAAIAGELPQDANRKAPDPALWDAVERLIWEGDFQGRFEDKESVRRMFDRRNAKIKATVPSDRLIVWRPEDGWPPLAEALGVPVPEIPFPYLHDTNAFRAEFGLAPLA